MQRNRKTFYLVLQIPCHWYEVFDAVVQIAYSAKYFFWNNDFQQLIPFSQTESQRFLVGLILY